MGLYYEIKNDIIPFINEKLVNGIAMIKNEEIKNDVKKIIDEYYESVKSINNFDLSFLSKEFNKDSIELKYIFMNIPWSEIDEAYNGDDVLDKYEKMIPSTNPFNGAKCSQSWMSSGADAFNELHCAGIDCMDCLRNALYSYRNYFLNK